MDIDGTSAFALYPLINCIPDVDNIRYFNATNVTLPMRFSDVEAQNMLFLHIQSDIYRETRAKFTNINCSDSHNTIFP